VSTMTVYESVSGRPVQIDSSSLVRTPDGYAVRTEDLVKMTAPSIPAPTASAPTDGGPSVSSRLVKLEGRLPRFEERLAWVERQLTRLDERLARLDERLAGLERRFDTEAAAAVKTIVRDEGGRITGIISEPAVTKHQPLVRNR
jgi:hypothetical protein